VEENDKKIFTKELVKTLFFVILMVTAIKMFVVQPFIVKGSSMEPNFQDNEYLFVDKFSYLFGGPKRGDVIILRYPEQTCSDFVNKGFLQQRLLPAPCTNFIKRVIALPGETVVVKDGEVKIKNSKNPEGVVLNESYIPGKEEWRLAGDLTRTLGEDEYFVLGDNRQVNASSDSRTWGPAPRNHILGKAWLQVLPINKIGPIKHASYPGLQK